MPNSQLATAAPMMPRTMFITRPVWLFMNFSASQPATPPMMMAAIQPTLGSGGIGGAPSTPNLVSDPRFLKDGGPDLWRVLRGLGNEIGAVLSLGMRAAPILLLLGPLQQHDLISNAALQSVAGMASVM